MNINMRTFPRAWDRQAAVMLLVGAFAVISALAMTLSLVTSPPAQAATPHSPVREQVIAITPAVVEERIEARTAAVAVNPMKAVATSRAARDLKGIEKSLYRGRYYAPKKGEDFRRCVLQRESKGDYRASNASPNSSAKGGYQFLDNRWRDSLVHMMMKEAKRNGIAKDVKKLRNKPLHRWNRFYQDWAFWRVYDRGAGAHHWHLAGSYCNTLA